MSLPHTYCKKCGTITYSLEKDPSKELCMMCGTLGTQQFVPEQYLDEYGDLKSGGKRTNFRRAGQNITRIRPRSLRSSAISSCTI